MYLCHHLTKPVQEPQALERSKEKQIIIFFYKLVSINKTSVEFCTEPQKPLAFIESLPNRPGRINVVYVLEILPASLNYTLRHS